MRPISESSILNLAMFIVAFGVVALVVIFAHPASQPMATAVNGMRMKIISPTHTAPDGAGTHHAVYII